MALPKGDNRHQKERHGRMIPEEQGLPLKVYQLGAGTKQYVTCCERVTRRRCRDNEYARVPLSINGRSSGCSIQRSSPSRSLILLGTPLSLMWHDKVGGREVTWKQGRLKPRVSEIQVRATLPEIKAPGGYHYLPAQASSQQDGPKSLRECICCERTIRVAWDEVTCQPMCLTCKKHALVLPETMSEDARCHECAMPNWMNQLRFEGPLMKNKAVYKCVLHFAVYWVHMQGPQQD